MNPLFTGVVFLFVYCLSVESVMAFPIPPSMRHARFGTFPARDSHVTFPIPEWAILCIFGTGGCTFLISPPPLWVFPDLFSPPVALLFSITWAYWLSIIARSRVPSFIVQFPRASNHPFLSCSTSLIFVSAHLQGTVRQHYIMPFVASTSPLLPCLRPTVLAAPRHAASLRVEEGSSTRSRLDLEVVGTSAQALACLWSDVRR